VNGQEGAELRRCLAGWLAAVAASSALFAVLHGREWFLRAAGAATLIAVLGAAGRAARLPRALLPLLQVAAGFFYVVAVFAPEQARAGFLPTGDTIDRLREMVCLGAGVGPDGRLDKQVAARALACLERFGQRLRDMHARSVRVVGTNALRISRRKQAFLERARDAIGHPIEIISGMEEARLVYSGVAHTLPAEAGRRLVIDIGGGSTEIVIGEGYEPQLLESLKLGCVSMSLRFFEDGKLSARRVERARLAARVEIEPVQAAFLQRGWEGVVGSSGTVRAIAECLEQLRRGLGFSRRTCAHLCTRPTSGRSMDGCTARRFEPFAAIL